MIKLRLALLISNYLGVVFQTQDKRDFYKKYIGFLFDNLVLKTESDKALCLQSIECLQNLFDDENLKKRNNNMLQDLIIRLIPLISTIKYVQFFDLLQDIIK